MTRRGFGMALSAVAAAVLVAACATSLPTYRYRLTVEVDTPQGLRSSGW